MAALKASELKYGNPVRISLGAVYLTATVIEFPSGKEAEGTEGGAAGELILKLSKLGLPDEVVCGLTEGFPDIGAAGKAGLGETATGTPAPLLAWSTPLVEAKTSGEKAKNTKVMFPTDLTSSEEKLILRLYNIPTAKGPFAEATAAEKLEFKPSVTTACTIFAIGR